MSLLTICQDIADEIGVTRPSSLIGATDKLSRQFLALSKKALLDLGEKDWPILERVATFPTVDGTQSYDVETDFERLVSDSAYISTQYYKMRGSLTPQEWQRQRYAMSSNLGCYKLRIFQNPLKIYLTPTPSTVETVVYEYITKYLAKDSGGTPKVTFTADSDLTVVDEVLFSKNVKWRMKHALGLDYSEDHNDYSTSAGNKFSGQRPTGTMPVAVRRQFELPEGYVPEDGFG